jgi:hypothetical protein
MTTPPVEAPGSTRDSGNDDDLVSKLERLASLRAAGALSEEEFNLAKQQLLPTRG